jgi:hypothetical protein
VLFTILWNGSTKYRADYFQVFSPKYFRNHWNHYQTWTSLDLLRWGGTPLRLTTILGTCQPTLIPRVKQTIHVDTANVCGGIGSLLSFVYLFGGVVCWCCWLAPRWHHFGPASLPPEWFHVLFTSWITNLSLYKLWTLPEDTFTLAKVLGKKTSAILYRDYATPACLGHLGQQGTNRSDPICVMSPRDLDLTIVTASISK